VSTKEKTTPGKKQGKRLIIKGSPKPLLMTPPEEDQDAQEELEDEQPEDLTTLFEIEDESTPAIDDDAEADGPPPGLPDETPDGDDEQSDKWLQAAMDPVKIYLREMGAVSLLSWQRRSRSPKRSKRAKPRSKTPYSPYLSRSTRLKTLSENCAMTVWLSTMFSGVLTLLTQPFCKRPRSALSQPLLSRC